MHAVAPDYPNFLDTNDSQFKVTHTIMDTYFRQLRMEEVGAVVKHANVISKEEENAPWEQGVLGNNTPNVYCVLFFFTTMGRVFVYAEAKSTVLRFHSL